MLFPISARSVALGQAVTARAGADGIFFNPAALIDLTQDQVVVHRSSVGIDQETQQLTTVSLLIHSKVAGVFGLTYRLLDYSTDDATDENNNRTGTLHTYDQVLIASFATAIGRDLSAGLNYRLYNWVINCDGLCGIESESATTHMLDAGLRYAPRTFPQLLLGASILHAGQKLQVNNAFQADFTPTRFRVGAAYDASRLITADSTVAVWLYTDAVARLHDARQPGINLGAEVILDNTIFFRAGHVSEADGISFGGTSVGIGVRYQRFKVDVAKSVSNAPALGEPFYVSFGLTF
jgi:hypothetical protein